MRDIHQWLEAYGESHQHPTNKLIHWVCVPAILFSIVGVLWHLSTIATFVCMGLSFVFYMKLSSPLAIAMLFVYVITLLIADLLGGFLLTVSLVVFIIAWIFQFLGHQLEGKKPSFFQDMQFLLIGPLWCLAFLLQKLKISF